MATIPLRLPKYEDNSAGQPINIIKPDPQNNDNGEITHVEQEAMPPTKIDDATFREAMHTMTMAVTAMARTITERDASKVSEVKRLWLPICAAVFISLGPQLWTANVMTRSNQDELKAQLSQALTVANDAKRDAADAAKEAKKANLNNALLDTYNRELERALIKKGIPLPSYPILQK